jgi:hypothetical protein
MRNPNNVELDDYFSDVAVPKALALRKEVDGKAGCTLLFHYLGHGTIVKTYTSMWLNQEKKDNCNPYPIESRLRNFAEISNAFVLGQINCCR